MRYKQSKLLGTRFMVGTLIGLAISLLIIFACSFANADVGDYDVEWPASNEPGVHLLLITVDGCATKFKINNKDFSAFTSNPEATAQALKKAIERADSGCRGQ